MNPLRRLLPAHLCLALMCVPTLAGCTERRDPPMPDAGPSIPFREDGNLVFLRAEGTPIDTIRIEIADTDSARTRGLMQRTGLPPRSGMLFIFDRQERQSFWMANTPLSLDMFFVDRDSQIVSIKKYTRPLSPESVVSDAPARFVIETPAGYADSRGITESARVTWDRITPAADTAATD